MYSPQEIQLAQELAKALNDESSLTFYLACTKKYSHRSLRKTLDHVLSIPQSNIRKSRGALFNHLVSQLARTDQKEADETTTSWDDDDFEDEDWNLDDDDLDDAHCQRNERQQKRMLETDEKLEDNEDFKI